MRVERASGAARVINVDFLGTRRGSNGGEVFFETPTGLMKAAFPRFLDGTEIATTGLLSAVDRRKELAQLITRSDDFAQTSVNFVWTQLYGYGLKRNSKEAPIHSSSSVLAPLVAEFVASGYDLKSVIRWAVLVDSYARSSQIADLASKDMPESGEPPLFSRFYEPPSRTAEASRVLVAAARIRSTAGSDSARKQARVDWLTQANRVDAKKGKVDAKKGKAAKLDKATTPSIIAMDGPASKVAATIPDGGLIARLTASAMPFEKKVEHVFWTTLARSPNQREATAASELLAAGGNNEAGALEDLWWSLVNSSECVLDR
jgi:hypothetical protein